MKMRFQMATERGTLYGIGVGPGDPDLLTMKAVKTMAKVDVIFTASSTKNPYSLAVEIASPHLPAHARVEALSFPMTANLAEKRTAWEENAKRIAAELDAGRNVAFLTLGDPMTYSTFGYITHVMRERFPDYPMETIPGITSFQAAAARVNTPLVEGEETLVIASGAYGGEHVRKAAAAADNMVLLKAYKHVDDIAAALKESGLAANSCAVKRCTREGEEVIRNVEDLRDVHPDYWTLVMAKKEGPAVPGNTAPFRVVKAKAV